MRLYGGVFGCGCIPILPRIKTAYRGVSVALCGACVLLALCGGSVRPVQFPGGVAVVEYPGRRSAALWAAVVCPVVQLPAGVVAWWTMDREKPGHALPGRKRTAAGIAPGAALVYLFIFKSSDKIANGIIKIIRTTNIFNFHPLYYAALYCLCVGVSCTSRRISFIAAFMAVFVSL